jgi:hypothetical protein
MTEVVVPSGLPRLAAGSYDRGAGKACIMNAISYLNGDITITDTPNCVDRILSTAAIFLNDRICPDTHKAKDDGNLLCGECSHKMWLLGARIMGTGETERGVLNSFKRKMIVEEFAHYLAIRFNDKEFEAIAALNATYSSLSVVISALIDMVWDSHSSDRPEDKRQPENVVEVINVLVDIYERTFNHAVTRTWSGEDFRRVAEEAKVLVVK